MQNFSIVQTKIIFCLRGKSEALLIKSFSNQNTKNITKPKDVTSHAVPILHTIY